MDRKLYSDDSIALLLNRKYNVNSHYKNIL